MWAIESDRLKEERLGALCDLMDMGGGGRIWIFDGVPRDVDLDDALATLEVPVPTKKLYDQGVLYLNDVKKTLVDKTGTSAWAIIGTAYGQELLRVDVSESTGNGVIKLDSETKILYAGGSISILDFYIS